MRDDDRVEHADALDWLQTIEPGTARAIVLDPPYSRGKAVRGKPDGAAGSVYGPFGFMHKVMQLCERTLMPLGIVVCFCDWELLPDIAYLASICGLRQRSHLVWCQERPGTGRLLRGAAVPVLIVSRTAPDVVDYAAVKNWVVASVPVPPPHPYYKPPAVLEHVLKRVCRRGDLVLDPFAGSGSSREACEKLGLELVWRGCDIDAQYAETTPSTDLRPWLLASVDFDWAWLWEHADHVGEAAQ